MLLKNFFLSDTTPYVWRYKLVLHLFSQHYSISRRRESNKTPEPEFANPRIGDLFNKWRSVWLSAMNRRRKLQDALERLNDAERLKHFDFDDWRRRYMRWMNHNKTRVIDFFRRQDKDGDGILTRYQFVDGMIDSRTFPFLIPFLCLYFCV